MRNTNIMEMKTGTIIKNKRSSVEYVLGDFANDVAREITIRNVIGNLAVDYINKNTQEDYEVIQQ